MLDETANRLEVMPARIVRNCGEGGGGGERKGEGGRGGREGGGEGGRRRPVTRRGIVQISLVSYVEI